MNETRTKTPADELYTEMGISEERAMFIMKNVESRIMKLEGFYTSEVIQAIQEEPEFENNEKIFATYILGIMQSTYKHMEALQARQAQARGSPLAEFLKSMSDAMPDELPDDVDCENCDRTDCVHHPTHDPANKRYKP